MVTSYGIALVKKNFNKNNYEILFIKKRISYAYITFVKGSYNKNNDNELIKLFNNMTIDEKICIMSLNFEIIWHKSYLTMPYKLLMKDLNKFENCKSKFEKRFLNDNGKRLLKLIKNTNSIDTIWEIPKGMSNRNESNINAAIREFSEETNIKKNKYKILFEIEPVIYHFTDENVTYKYIYYIAIMLDNKYIPNLDLSLDKNSMMETSDIKFLNLREIEFINNDKKFIYIIKQIIKLAKKYYFKNSY